jgi:hypothetical protein
MNLMIRARWLALKHMRFCFPRKGCQIWRGYSHAGFKTYIVFCQCGEVFGADDRGKSIMAEWMVSGFTRPQD